MPSSYTSRLKLERQASGENSGTWGDLVNYTFNRLDAGIDGWANVNVAGSANVTLTSNNATTNTDDSTTDDQVHNRTIEFFGALTGNINVFSGDVENSFTVYNNTTGSYTLTFGPTTGTGVAIDQGTKAIVYSDGSTMVDVGKDLGNINVLGIGNQASSNYFTLPDADGSAGQALTTDGSKALTFANVTGGVTWQTVITADPANAAVNQGYFCNTAGGAFTVTLPVSATLGDEIAFVDYAGTFDSANLTVGRNSHNIQGASSDLTVSIERAAFTLVYVDATQGWLLKDN